MESEHKSLQTGANSIMLIAHGEVIARHLRLLHNWSDDEQCQKDPDRR